MNRLLRILGCVALCLAVAGPAFAQARTYKVLATNRTGTMEKELNAAGETGYRFVAVMGGETAIGGKEVVALMERVEGDTNKYSYRLLATNRTSTLEKEMNEAADAGYGVVGQTVFESTFGGKETAAIVERNPADTNRYVYKLLATSRTSTMEKEIRELAETGFQAIGMTVGKTAMGGSELVVIARKKK